MEPSDRVYASFFAEIEADAGASFEPDRPFLRFHHVLRHLSDQCDEHLANANFPPGFRKLIRSELRPGKRVIFALRGVCRAIDSECSGSMVWRCRGEVQLLVSRDLEKLLHSHARLEPLRVLQHDDLETVRLRVFFSATPAVEDAPRSRRVEISDSYCPFIAGERDSLEQLLIYFEDNGAGSDEPLLTDLLIFPGSATADDIAEFYAALANYYTAVRGSGLRIVSDERKMPVPEGVVL
jgi:hypothetical protein